MAVMIAVALGVGIALTLLWFSARSAITVCVLEVKNGKITVTSGRIATRVLQDLRDVVKKPKVKAATIRIVRAKTRARVEARGLRPVQLQQVRNVVGNVPLAQLTNV